MPDDRIIGEWWYTAEPPLPILVKYISTSDKLSVQVHPDGECGVGKTEMWHILYAEPGAQIALGFEQPIGAEALRAAALSGEIERLLRWIPVHPGETYFIPAGTIHAIGAGISLCEIQQNSDTTYRVFDWNRVGLDGKPRELHIPQSLASIDFNDCQPGLIKAEGELLVRHKLFEIQKWNLTASREVVPPGQFAIIGCLTGSVRCADVDLAPGEFFLLPAEMPERSIAPIERETSLLRVTIPL